MSSLYATNARYVARVLRRLGALPADVDDLVQEVFIVVLRRIPDYEYRGRTAGWLFGICLRVVAAHRRRTVRAQARAASAAGLSCEVADPERAAVEQARRHELDELLGRLAPELRQVLVLFEIEERDCQEIARLMATPVGTVYSRLHAARLALARVALRARANEA